MVVLSGAVLAGAAVRIQSDTELPVIDGGSAGGLMARAMIELTLVLHKMSSPGAYRAV